MNITIDGWVYTVKTELDLYRLLAGVLTPNFKVTA